MLRSKMIRLLRSSNPLNDVQYGSALRNSGSGPKPIKNEETQEEDVYEKMCREEKERVRKRDEDSAQNMKVKSLPAKVFTYGAIIIVNYYIFRNVYDYVANVNSAADKTASIK